MKAVIEVDVPEYQIGQDVSVYFKDTMCVKSVCKKKQTRKKKTSSYDSSAKESRCNNCQNNTDELSGECYECVKGIEDWYEPLEENKE